MRRAVLALAILSLALPGCSDDGEGSSPSDDVVLRVVDGNTVARDWTLADLEAEIPFAEIVVDGDAQAGPRLVDVIAASGIDQWETGQVLGMSEGRVVTVELDIESSQVDETWVFDLTNRGTLKLASPDLQREKWVRDVGELRFP
jgi:hypothetical protein